MSGKAPSQQQVVGASGSFVNTYWDDDRATGELELPLHVWGEVVVNALVGGGADCANEWVALKVDGKLGAPVCGKRDEVLRPAVLTAAVPEGASVSLVLHDGSSEGWGHLLVDDVLVMSPH